MKVKFGMIIVDGSGKLGGHVVTQTKSGKAIRTKSSPVNRRSNAQQSVKSIFAANAQAFRGLTTAQIAAWNSASADWKLKNYFGDVMQLSGMALYQRLNANIVKAGGAVISDPPAQVPVEAIGDLAIATCTALVMTTTFVPTPVPADCAVMIEATRSVSPGVSFVKNQFRVIAVEPAAGTSPVNIYNDYVAVHGAPVTGKKVFLRATMVNVVTGQTGVSAQAVVVVG